MTWYVGRFIDHVHLVVADLPQTTRFYQAVREVLELPPGDATPHYFQADELFVSQLEPGGQLSHVHLAFQARDRETVIAFHAAALAAGGTDNGAPGERSYHPGYYAAYVLDPDGNNIEAVFHGPSTRSANAVTIEST